MLVSPADMVARAKATIKECSVTEVHNCLEQDTMLLDIREPAEFQRGHLPGAMLLPRGLLEFEIHTLVERVRADRNGHPAEQDIVLYCGTGGRSALAAEAMQNLGYRNVKSMAGGIIAWAEAGLPIHTPG
ncbi:MAG: rhodanese-like domain-containing protein [Alphaproteobacteria bacterium]|nr:rhodanese-like domain-containing protein [Alphaproteobacteria bacterium]